MAHTPPGRTRERVWRFVRERLLAGDPPTVREVQQALGFRAVESARAHLEALVADGRLEKDAAPAVRDVTGRGAAARGAARKTPARGRSRGYRLPFASWGSLSPALVPVVGHVQAGALTTALEEPEGVVAVQSRVPAEELFALHVRGDSMRDAGILDGDLVVVRRQQTAEDGCVVVALVGEEATVKRLRLVRDAAAGRGGVRVELHPENPDFEVIVPPPGEVRLLGRVVEVRRHLDPATAPPWRGGVPGGLTSPRPAASRGG
jgi:repressor LexA